MSNDVKSDALVTVDDVLRQKSKGGREDFKRLTYELIAREPELAIVLSEEYNLVATLLEGIPMSITQRTTLNQHLPLLAWAPLLLLDQAHRRAWDNFLPSENVIDEPGEKGGAK